MSLYNNDETLISVGDYYLDKVYEGGDDSYIFYRIYYAEKSKGSYKSLEEAIINFGKLIRSNKNEI